MDLVLVNERGKLGEAGGEGRDRKGEGKREGGKQGERKKLRGKDWEGGRESVKNRKREEKRMKKCLYRLIKHMVYLVVIFSK